MPANSRNSHDSQESQDSDKKVRIRVKTDPPTDPRSVKAPKNKSAMKKEVDPDDDKHKEPKTSRDGQESNPGNSADESLWQIASAQDKAQQDPQEVVLTVPEEDKNLIDGKATYTTESTDKNQGNLGQYEGGNEKKSYTNTKNADYDGDKINVTGQSTTGYSKEAPKTGEDSKERSSVTAISLKPSDRNARGMSGTVSVKKESVSSQPDKEKEQGKNSADPSTEPKSSENEFRNPTSKGDIEKQTDTLPADLSTQGSNMELNENERNLDDKSDIAVVDPLAATTSSKSAVASKTMTGSREIPTGDDEIKDNPTTKVSTKVRRNTNEEQAIKVDENEGIDNRVAVTTSQTIVARVDSGSLNQASKTQAENEMVEADEVSPGTDEEPTMSKQTEPSQNEGEEKENGLTDGSRKNENAEERKDAEKREDKKDGRNDVPILLRRTTGSEDLKIKEEKDRVRPGQVFVVRGETDSFTVKWAEKRKVLAYKVGSKNTSRFSTVLIETVEQLERASVRHPSILSEFTHPTKGSYKGSILSTYLAGANTRRNIKEHLIRDAGTNTDQKMESTARENVPENNLWATDHLSSDKEIFGGAEQVQTSKGDTTFESNNYNYPFLTDYDVNHKRK